MWKDRRKDLCPFLALGAHWAHHLVSKCQRIANKSPLRQATSWPLVGPPKFAYPSWSEFTATNSSQRQIGFLFFRSATAARVGFSTELLGFPLTGPLGFPDFPWFCLEFSPRFSPDCPGFPLGFSQGVLGLFPGFPLVFPLVFWVPLRYP